MKERPILFSGPMVRALLAGAKTQTRRIMNPQPQHVQVHEWKGRTLYDAEHRLWWWKTHSFENLIDFNDGRAELAKLSPYGVSGDRLWVRESWNAIRYAHGEPYAATKIPTDGRNWSTVYAATESQPAEDRGFGWRPGIHMPRWASRLTLDVFGVRVERLHDISEADAKAEGVEAAENGSFRTAYEQLWDDINGEAMPWSSNPFVWVVDFKVCEVSRWRP